MGRPHDAGPGAGALLSPRNRRGCDLVPGAMGVPGGRLENHRRGYPAPSPGGVCGPLSPGGGGGGAVGEPGGAAIRWHRDRQDPGLLLPGGPRPCPAGRSRPVARLRRAGLSAPDHRRQRCPRPRPAGGPRCPGGIFGRPTAHPLPHAGVLGRGGTRWARPSAAALPGAGGDAAAPAPARGRDVHLGRVARLGQERRRTASGHRHEVCCGSWRLSAATGNPDTLPPRPYRCAP